MKDISEPQPRLDANGIVDYSELEHDIWRQLIEQQLQLIPAHACQEYLDGLERLNLPYDHIPQRDELNKPLMAATGWQVEYISALPHYDDYFSMLAEKIFPIAPFIRAQADINMLGENDIFARVFGHCPLLTNPAYAGFLQDYGRLGQAMDKQQRISLSRLYWFTTEVGLIETPQGVRAYGASLLTCAKAMRWSLESIAPRREAFDPVLTLRTPYRRDILQPLFYVLDSFDILQQLTQSDVSLMLAEARITGLLPPLFTND